MDLKGNDKSYEALTVGSLNVIGDVKGGFASSVHTHLQTLQGGQSKLSAELKKIYENISADGVISANEKHILKKELTIIETEYPIIVKRAEDAKKEAVHIEAYKKAFKDLTDYLYEDLKIFDDMTSIVEVDRDKFNGVFANYYKARAVLQINKDGSEKAISFPQDADCLLFCPADEAGQTVPQTSPSFTAWQKRIIEYDCTGKDRIEATFEEALYDVIILYGTLKSNFTFQLFFDAKNGNGAKHYLIIFKLEGDFNLEIKTNVSGSRSVLQAIKNETYGLGCYAVVDKNGNVFHFKGEKGSGGAAGSFEKTNKIEDEDLFLIEQEKELKKADVKAALSVIQKFDSPIGEVKVFYENEYKHGFLEANGLPFSPDVFPELSEYVKKVFKTEKDKYLNWPIRPKIIKNDGTYIFLKAVQGV